MLTPCDFCTRQYLLRVRQDWKVGNVTSRRTVFAGTPTSEMYLFSYQICAIVAEVQAGLEMKTRHLGISGVTHVLDEVQGCLPTSHWTVSVGVKGRGRGLPS